MHMAAGRMDDGHENNNNNTFVMTLLLTSYSMYCTYYPYR